MDGDGMPPPGDMGEAMTHMDDAVAHGLRSWRC